MPLNIDWQASGDILCCFLYAVDLPVNSKEIAAMTEEGSLVGELHTAPSGPNTGVVQWGVAGAQC